MRYLIGIGMTWLMGAGMLAHGGGLDGPTRDACAAEGGEYDVLRGCVKGAKTADATALIRAWREASEKNTRVFFDVDREGCRAWGAAHVEPDLSGLTAVRLKFSDGDALSVVPHEMSCAKQNDRFELSSTTCKISFYRVRKGALVFEERTLTTDPPRSRDLAWADPKGDAKGTLTALTPASYVGVTDQVGVKPSAGGPGANCELVKLASKYGPSYRAGAPGGGAAGR